MDLGSRISRLRAFHGRLWRVVAGAAAASVLLVAVPSPAAAVPTPSVTITDVAVTEGTGSAVNASFTIQANPRPRASTLQVSWATAPGSATAPADFTSSSGTVSLTKVAFSKVVTVPVIGDASDEPNETFVVNLTNLVGTPGVIGDAQGVASITDDDQPPTISVNNVSVTEGDTATVTATFTASLSVVSANAVTFDWATAVGSATQGVDYVASSGSRTIAAGATAATVGITVNGDILDEADETFDITLSDPGNATIADGSGLGTITDDDPLPLLSIDDVSLTEGNAGTSIATFAVTLSAASGKTVTVGWATADDGAAQPADYTTSSGTLTFVPGDMSKPIPVTVNGDLSAELDETFSVNLSAPSNATLGDANGVGTIVDDANLPVIDIDDSTIAEGQSETGPITFSVTLSNPAALPVTVDWSTADGTAANGVDYLQDNGTVTFASNDTTETITVTVNGDASYEGDETLLLDLSNATGVAPIGDPQGIGTIANDDAAPIVSVTNASVVEGNAGTSLLTFAVSATGATDVDASVDFATAGTTASAGSDFVSTSGTLTIPAGTANGTIDVIVNGDVTYESNETLSLTLSNPADATVGDGTGQGTIVNNDKMTTALTLKVVRKPRAVIANGLLEPTRSGHRVTSTLFRKRGTKFVKVAAKTVRVRYFKDRDGDGKKDGAYTVTFVRPKAQGSYKVLVRFNGTATHKPCSRSLVFTLPAS
jgi:large repetitive protein